MPNFRCVPIATETAERFRCSGRDDRAAPLHQRTAGTGSFPCRHCLDNAAAGEAVLLGSYDLPRPRGVYWTPSPIFLHARSCERFDRAGVVPAIVRTSLVSVRAYDAGDMCLYELGQVCDGGDVEAPLRRALDDPRTAFVNLHTARPGCLLCHVVRA